MSRYSNNSPPNMPTLSEYQLDKSDINDAIMALQSLSGVPRHESYVPETEPSIRGYYNPRLSQPEQDDYSGPYRKEKPSDFEPTKLPRSDLASLTELLGTGIKGRQPPMLQQYEPDYLTEKDLIRHVKAAAKDLYNLVSHNESVNEAINRSEDPERLAARRRHASKVHTIVDRLYQSHQQKEHKLDMLRRRHEEEELAAITQAPTISEGSKSILSSQPIRPLYKRYLALQDEKEEARFRAQMEEEDRKREREAKDSVPQPRHKSARRVGHKNMMEFMRHNEEKQAKKMDEIHLKELEKLVAEMDKLTFKPHISKNSQKIFEKKMQKDGIDRRLEDRLHRYHAEKKKNLKNLEKELQPTFTPMINRNTRVLAEKIRRRGEEEAEEFDLDDKENLIFVDKSSSPISRKGVLSRSRTPTKKPDAIINVVNYTPDMKFLLKKVVAKKNEMKWTSK